ncbi:MAG: hypothetical protein GX786_10785 [Clostridiales bacterium]|nr:hypothetical protein [Clostridiales bacterium]
MTKDTRKDLIAFLNEQGYNNITHDHDPGHQSWTGVFFYDNKPLGFLPSLSNQFIQFQMRGEKAEDVLIDLTKLTNLFISPSGIPEEPIFLNGTEYHCRIKRHPGLLMHNSDSTVTYYSEIILYE